MKVIIHELCEFDLGLRPIDPEARKTWKMHAKVMIDLIRISLSKHNGKPPGARIFDDEADPPMYIWRDGNWTTSYTLSETGGMCEIVRVQRR